MAVPGVGAERRLRLRPLGVCGTVVVELGGENPDPRRDVRLIAGVRPVELPSSASIDGPGSEKRTLFFDLRGLSTASLFLMSRSSFAICAFVLVFDLVKDLVLTLRGISTIS